MTLHNWIAIYSVDSAIQPSKNWGQAADHNWMMVCLTSTIKWYFNTYEDSSLKESFRNLFQILDSGYLHIYKKLSSACSCCQNVISGKRKEIWHRLCLQLTFQKTTFSQIPLIWWCLTYQTWCPSVRPTSGPVQWLKNLHPLRENSKRYNQ